MQQGNHFAPLCFALDNDECICPTTSEINIRYLDDGVLAREISATVLATPRGKLLEIELQMNTEKCKFTPIKA